MYHEMQIHHLNAIPRKAGLEGAILNYPNLWAAFSEQ